VIREDTRWSGIARIGANGNTPVGWTLLQWQQRREMFVDMVASAVLLHAYTVTLCRFLVLACGRVPSWNVVFPGPLHAYAQYTPNQLGTHG
jgi:hypothetical protein